MIPAYLIYDNKGNLYGLFTSLEKAKEVKTRIEKKMHEKDELKDIKIKMIFTL
jgi:hypothetical protein